MTEEQIKEQLSRRFLEVLANRHGFRCTEPKPDSGVDADITRAIPRNQNGRVRYIDSGEHLEVRLKAVSERRLIPDRDGFKYDLDVTAYNDLVHRQQSRALVPLILVVVVLPDDPDQWVLIDPDQLVVRRRAYWYIPSSGAAPSSNTSTERILLPNSLRIGLTFVPDRFAEFFDD